MNKAEFVEALAGRLDGDKKTAAAAVDGVVQTVYTAVAKGEKVQLTGFGVFEKRARAARTARNPATGASVRVKKTSVPAFRAGAEFKQIVSGAKKVAKAPAKKAAAKSTSARATATKSVARKTAAKAAPGRTAATKTAAAKSTATRGTAKKTATKAPARKTATTTAGKTAARKAPAKRAR